MWKWWVSYCQCLYWDREGVTGRRCCCQNCRDLDALSASEIRKTFHWTDVLPSLTSRLLAACQLDKRIHSTKSRWQGHWVWSFCLHVIFTKMLNSSENVEILKGIYSIEVVLLLLGSSKFDMTLISLKCCLLKVWVTPSYKKKG